MKPHAYLLRFAFRGTDFCGWQDQPGCRTVQGVMETVLRRVTGEADFCLTGCSRTDTGVHALEMAASFHAAHPLDLPMLCAALEKQFPPDIRLISAEPRDPGFNAHTAVCGKAYVYAVCFGARPLFLKDLVWGVDGAADPRVMDEVLGLFRGVHDFCNFTSEKPDAATTVREIFRAERRRFGPVDCFYFSGNGFLHKMIRRLMGVVREVAQGNCSADTVRRMLTEPGFRPFPDAVAPARGLYLKKAFFSPDELRRDPFDSPPFLL